MIITLAGIIVFHLTERIAIDCRSPKGKYKSNELPDMLGFSYQAIPSRHEIPMVLQFQEVINININ